MGRTWVAGDHFSLVGLEVFALSGYGVACSLGFEVAMWVRMGRCCVERAGAVLRKGFYVFVRSVYGGMPPSYIVF